MRVESSFLSPLTVRALTLDELRAQKSATQLWQLCEDLVYSSETLGRVVVPAGFVTDFASVPGACKWFVDDDAPVILLPSVVHDFLYSPESETGCTRAQADAVLSEAMGACGANFFQRKIILLAVRSAGVFHWKK